ncbi:hypothetical protein CPB97_004553, partial [Podila verticillata]
TPGTRNYISKTSYIAQATSAEGPPVGWEVLLGLKDGDLFPTVLEPSIRFKQWHQIMQLLQDREKRRIQSSMTLCPTR